MLYYRDIDKLSKTSYHCDIGKLPSSDMLYLIKARPKYVRVIRH